jgi:spore coat polysaccharide biosynthesis protein SpsF
MNEQEIFWSGDFGESYIKRNKSDQFLRSNIQLFSKILDQTGPLTTLLELGANVGMNIHAIKHLSPKSHIDAVEINPIACQALMEANICREVYNTSISNFETKSKYDLTFTKTVMIHLNEKDLQSAYKALYETSLKYILIAEYYNPNPVSIKYRGHKNKLFKRDFCSELMKLYANLSLVDYGFVYHNDPKFPLDDITWFLLKK